MQVAIAIEQRFYRMTDGSIKTDSAVGSYDFWSRYRQAFDSVLLLARVANAPHSLASGVEGPGVSVYPLSDYLGPTQFILTRKVLKRDIERACADSDALIARVPGVIGDLAIREYIKMRRPFGVYVVGDPAEVFRRGIIKHPLRPILGWVATRNLGRWCRESSSVAYVTKHYLQGRYPPASQFATHFSDVDLPPEAFAEPRQYASPPVPLRIISVAVLSQRYKGIDVLLNAIAALRRNDVPCSLDLVGDGALRSELEHNARHLGIRDLVTFTGQLSDACAVRERLEAADLFVLPSLAEGLPRALLEAMARGLPCVASSVGGVPELLAPSDLVPPGKPEELATKILELARNPEHLEQASSRNFRTASDYRMEATHVRRTQFCSHVYNSAVVRA